MPSVDYSRPLLDAEAGVASEWGSASIQGGLLAALKAELRRGFAIDLGLGALVNADASFSQYVSAEAQGEAHAEVRLTGQAQLPFDIFSEAGAAIRLKIAAEAAAGVTLRLGLSIGDFLALAENDLQIKGLPLRLLTIILEEAEVGGGVYAKAAVSAMAYANLVASLRAVPGVRPEERPGFSVLAEMGAGLKAGAGFRVFFNAGINNFPRLVGRSIDACVDEVVDGMTSGLPETATTERTIAEAFRPCAKMSLRIAFETGLLLSSSVPATAEGARKLALRATQVILEESQRFLLERIALASVKEFEATVGARWNALAADAQETVRPRIEAFANRLLETPDEPFHPEHAAFWVDLLAEGVLVTTAFAPQQRAAILKGLSLTWAAIELMSVAVQRVSEPTARASFSLAGLQTGQVESSFAGPLSHTPPTEVRVHILTALGRNAQGTLTLDDLIAFVVKEGVAVAEQRVPEVTEFLGIFRAALAAAGPVPDLLLKNLGAVIRNAHGVPDEQETLRLLAQAIGAFVVNRFEASLAPIVANASPEAKLYLEEVLQPSLRATIDLVLSKILEWDSGTVNETALREMLSAIVTMLLGRSVAVTADILLAVAQNQLRDAFNDAADHVGDSGLVQVLRPLAGASTTEEIKGLAEDALRVAGDVFGPLATDERARIRGYLFALLAPLPPTGAQNFYEGLSDATMLPDPAALHGLSDELATITARRFLDFVSKLLVRVGERILEELLEVLEEIRLQVVAWLGDLHRGLIELAASLVRIAQEIARLAGEVRAAIERASAEFINWLAGLGNQAGRQALRDAFETVVFDAARPILDDNLIYAVLPPDVKSTAKGELRKIIRGFFDSALVDVVLDAIGDTAADWQAFVEEVRALHPSQGLVSGIANLLLDRVTDRLHVLLGGTITVPIRFDVAWSVVYWDFNILNGKWTKRTIQYKQTIDLGSFKVDVPDVMPALREALEALGVFEQHAQAMATQFLELFAFEIALEQEQQKEAAALAEQKDGEQQAAEAIPAPRSIAIDEPIAGQFCDGDVSIAIRLEGVPDSFLGLAGSQQRAYVWLNGIELPMSRFQVTGGGMPPTSATTGVIRLPGATRALPAEIDLLNSPLWTAAAAADIPRRAPGASPEHRRRTAAATGETAERSRPIVVRSTDRRRAKDAVKPLVMVGKRLTPGARPTRTPAAGGELLLHTVVPLADLEPGINVLTAAVVDGHGPAVRAAVTFLAADPATAIEDAHTPTLGHIREFRDLLRATGGTKGVGTALNRRERGARARKAIDDVVSKRAKVPGRVGAGR